MEKIISQTGSSLLAFTRSALPGSSWLQRATIEEQENQDCLGQEGYFGFVQHARHRKDARMVSTCVTHPVKHEGGGVVVLCQWHAWWQSHQIGVIHHQHTTLCSRSPSHSWTSNKFTSGLWKSHWTSEEWCVSDVLASTSSDLNPIEMVWDELDHKVKAKKPAQHLWEFWNVGKPSQQRLMEGKPWVCKAVNKGKGGSLEDSKISNIFWLV